MSESRDRLFRTNDNVVEQFSRRRQLINTQGILPDELEVGSITPFRWGSTALTGAREQPVRMAALHGARTGRGTFGTPRGGTGRGRSISRTPSTGRENTPTGNNRRGRGRFTGSALPSWYPRRPLQDITAVVRGFERRRARLRDIDGQQESPTVPQEGSAQNPSLAALGAELEHKSSSITPNSAARIKSMSSVGKIPKLLLDISNQNATGKPGELTPQKKLLNSIDIVEKVVMEELRNLKRTPAAKRAEREKRVRTLMSMR